MDEQKEIIRRYALHKGLDVSRWFEEIETASKVGRPVFNEMLALLKKGGAAGVIIHKVDRGARNFRDWAEIGDLRGIGIEVHFATEALDLNTLGGMLTADLQAVMSVHYSRNLNEEVKKGYYGRLRQGLCPRPAPLGYLNNGEGKPKTIDPVQGPIVRQALSIVKLVKNLTGLEAFFAEEVQDLNGLDSNILGALRDCAAFITAMHPRGKIIRPDNSIHIRASVWIEQEVAIATYIQRVEKRALPVIAFIHESVGREGIRDLLHLNPIPFTHETEVLAALPELLRPWKDLSASGLRVQLQSSAQSYREGHWIRQLVVSFVNEGNQRINQLNCQVRLPTGILKHWSSLYPTEVKSDDPNYRCFRFDEKANGPISPHTTGHLITFEYCPQFAAEYTREIPAIAAAIVGESVVEARVWVENREYSTTKTIKELGIEAESRRQ